MPQLPTELTPLVGSSLVWFDQPGIGWLDIQAQKIDYFDHYEEIAESEIAGKLNSARVEFVNSHHSGAVVDIGIGNGAFILARGGETFGYDIDKKSMDWLCDRRLFKSVLGIHKDTFEAMTFWDSIEHIEYPAHYFNRIKTWAFISTPIYCDLYSVLTSKHYKPKEHRWYFTRKGLIWLMERHSFELVAESDSEIKAGRESIGMFAFRRCG